MKGKCFTTLLVISFILPLSLYSVQETRLSESHKKWLEEEVVYIISPAEKEVFLKLETDRERDNFIEEFWRQRDPTPGTPRNEFREEHYLKIDFANRTFGRGTPVEGWRTDRGKFYIMLGRPASVQKYSTFDIHPIEIWYYNGNPKLGQEPIFLLTFFKRGGIGVYELYNPMRDGPKDLVPFHERYPDTVKFDDQGGVELDAGSAADIQGMSHLVDGRDIQAYLLLKENIGHELADASFSNFPGRKGPTYKLPSAILIKDVETYPTKKINDDYAYEFDAAEAFLNIKSSICFFGHTHFPFVYTETDHLVEGTFLTGNDNELKIERGVRYLINPGSVGQPRDRNTRAACAIYDSKAKKVRFFRLEYNIEEAQKKILKAKLPPALAERLSLGI